MVNEALIILSNIKERAKRSQSCVIKGRVIKRRVVKWCVVNNAIKSMALAGSILYSTPSLAQTEPLTEAPESVELEAPTAQQFNHAYSVPGGVALLKIDKVNNKLPRVRFGTREVALIESDSAWIAVIGLQLSTIPGYYVVYIKHDNSEISASTDSFMVGQKNYLVIEPNEDVRLADKAPHDYELFSELDYENTSPPSLPMLWPVEGRWGHVFGRVESSENALSKNFVGLTDTTQGVVIAPQNALISKIEALSAAEGNSELEAPLSRIFLDHGRGIYSIISGLTDLTVQVGNGVVAGAVIGRIPPQISTTNSPAFQSAENGTQILGSASDFRSNTSTPGVNSEIQVQSEPAAIKDRTQTDPSTTTTTTNQVDSLVTWQVVINGAFVDPEPLTQASILNFK